MLNEEVLKRVGKRLTILETINKLKINWLGHWVRRYCILEDPVEDTVEGKRGRR